MRRVMSAWFERPMSAVERQNGLLGRREVLRVGGATITLGALVAACGQNNGGTVGRVGDAPPVRTLPPAVVNDVVLLRTATSIEISAINAYSAVAELGVLDDVLDGLALEYVKRFVEDHTGHAELFSELTVAAGGVAWTEGNCRLDAVFIAPVVKRITVGDPDAPDGAIPPSDDAVRDVLNVAHALESLAGASYQSLVPTLTDVALRRDAMKVAADEVRHAALLALTINAARPSGWVDSAAVQSAEPPAEVTTTTAAQDIAQPATTTTEPAAPTATPIPLPTAVPTQFGSVAAIPVVVGAGDVNGVRLRANLETPSLNSLIYEYLDTCPVL
jgi:rubrerythrin